MKVSPTRLPVFPLTETIRSGLRPVVLAFGLAFAAVPHALAFESGSTGADGAFAPTVNTEVLLPPSGVLNYTSVNIPAGVIVTFRKNTLNTPVQILVSGDATIAGIIDVSGTRGADTGTAGNGNLADDGVPGVGGPGGYDGGRGGRASTDPINLVTRGGAGLGPGGGFGAQDGRTINISCFTADSVLNASNYNIGGHGGFGVRSDHGENGGGSCTKPSLNGIVYGSAVLQPLIGGSGGGGGGGGTAFGGEGGGGGGGALMLAVSGTLNHTGTIRADGGGANRQTGTNVGGRGGAGSGGAVRLVATSFSGNGRVIAQGGCRLTSENCGDGTASSRAPAGRIRFEAENLTFNPTGANVVFPAASVDQPGPVFLSNVPTLRITRVGGQDVPANPTGRADLSFPSDLPNPVTVEFSTTNVPAGNTVRMQVIPAQGPVIEALSPAIVTTGSEGSASVQITLPQGPSVLQATTTYTVVVAMGDALSHFAQNERVEKVELIATLGGEAKARLITVSGKAYVVPASVLQTVGLAG